MISVAIISDGPCPSTILYLHDAIRFVILNK